MTSLFPFFYPIFAILPRSVRLWVVSHVGPQLHWNGTRFAPDFTELPRRRCFLEADWSSASASFWRTAIGSGAATGAAEVGHYPAISARFHRSAWSLEENQKKTLKSEKKPSTPTGRGAKGVECSCSDQRLAPTSRNRKTKAARHPGRFFWVLF